MLYRFEILFCYFSNQKIKKHPIFNFSLITQGSRFPKSFEIYKDKLFGEF